MVVRLRFDEDMLHYDYEICRLRQLDLVKIWAGKYKNRTPVGRP